MVRTRPTVLADSEEDQVADDPELATAPGLAELSEREKQVFEHLAGGLSNADIARTMFVSEATVKTYINRLFSKLGVRDRVQAVIFAYESGFVFPGPRAEH